VLPAGKPTWAANGFRNWAPELHRVDGRFVAYFTTVNASDVLCMMMGLNGGLDGLAYRFDSDAIRSLGMTDLDLQTIIAGFTEELQKVEGLIS
jgi:hypothetical protein